MPNIINLITPNNLAEERAKFMASRSYNPTFKYSWQGQKNYPVFQSDHKQKLWQSIQTQDSPNITYHAGKLFGVVTSDILSSEAKSIARTEGTSHSGSAEEYKTLLEEGLRYFGLGHYQVLVSTEGGFNARPQPSKQRLIISQDAHFEFFSMMGEVHHELVHILRHVNGVYNHIKKSLDYLPTEEGLASWCQDHTVPDRGHQQHAIEYLGSEIGVRGSLRDIYNTMRDFGMSEDLAWKRASRHKFGFVDTSKPGDIMKPAMYFVNETKVDKLSPDERLRLFVGKITITDLPQHLEYSGKWDKDQLTTYFTL